MTIASLRIRWLKKGNLDTVSIVVALPLPQGGGAGEVFVAGGFERD
jgi:hypothetical protein